MLPEERILELENRIKVLEETWDQFEIGHLWKIYAPSSIPTLLLDASGVIMKWNASASLLTGYTHSELPDINTLIERLAPNKEKWEFYSDIRGKVMHGEMELIQGEFTIKGKDGKSREVEVSIFEVLLESGSQILRVLQAVDISERKNAERALRESEEKYRNLFEMESDALILIRNSDGQILEVNPAASAIYGYAREELLSKKNYELSAEPDETRKAVASQSTAIPIRYHRRKDGTVFPVEITGRHCTYGGEMSHIAAIRDISELRKQQAIVEEQRHFFRRIIDNNPNFIYVYDKDGKFVLTNQAVADLFGTSIDALTGKTILTVSHDKAHREATYRDHMVLLQGESERIEREEVYLNRNGDQGWVYSVKLPLKNEWGEVEYLIGVSTDITELKRAERALRESEELFRLAFRLSPDAVNINRLADGVFLDINEGFTAITGYTLDHVLHKSSLELGIWNNPEDRAKLAEGLTANGYVRNLEAQFRCRDGQVLTGLMSASVITLNREKCIISITRDITDRKRMEERLLQYKFAVESADSLIFVVDCQYRFQLANKVFLKYHDLLDENIAGKDVSPIIGELVFTRHMKPHMDKALLGKTVTHTMSWEFPNMGKRELNMVYYPLLGEKTEISGVVGVIQDISEQVKAELEKKTLQEQLYHAQKMESIGRLAGGIAHDFNNILTGIMGWAEMIKLKTTHQRNDLSRAAEIIVQGAEQAASLTKQLLGFARAGKYNPEPLCINEAIRETLSVSEKIFEKNIRLVLKLDENIHPVEADKSQIMQVFTNLIINAKDAMAMGGELSVQTDNVILGDQEVFATMGLIPGQYVKIKITDTGIGMPDEIKRHIFEPFFTTKSKGKGTGLGLATAYGIIKNHSGHITIESEPGQGSTVEIYLPVTHKKIECRTAQQEYIRGRSSILVIDDEQNVRELMKEQIESLGYEVYLAGDGNEGIEIYKNARGAIDLVLLDMIMPNMAGRETFYELRKINPDVKVYLVSGFSQDAKAEELLKNGAYGFLEKPFRLQELSLVLSKH